MNLTELFETISEDDDSAFNAMLLGKRIKAAGFVEWKPTNREDEHIFERVTWYKSPVFLEGRFPNSEDHWMDEFFVYFEIEAYPVSVSKPEKGERYIVEMGVQDNNEVFRPGKGPSIRLGPNKDTTSIEKESPNPKMMLKHVDSMLASYKKYVESKYKKAT